MNKIINFLKTRYMWTLFIIAVIIYLISLIFFRFNIFGIYIITCFLVFTKYIGYYIECPKCKNKIEKGKEKCSKCDYEVKNIKDEDYQRKVRISAIIKIILGVLFILLTLYLLMYIDTRFELLNPDKEVIKEYFDLVLEKFIYVGIPSIILTVIIKIFKDKIKIKK